MKLRPKKIIDELTPGIILFACRLILENEVCRKGTNAIHVIFFSV